MIDVDLDVRDRLPDRVERGLDIVETVASVALTVTLFIIAVATSYGIVTGIASVSDAAALILVLCGIPAVLYIAGRLRGDAEQKATAAVTAGEIVVYAALGVGIAVAPSPVDTAFFYFGVGLAVLIALKYEWVTTRLGFENLDEEVAA